MLYQTNRRRNRDACGGAVRKQLVEDLIERIFLQRIEADAENVGERRASDPGRHGVLGGGRNQPIKRHHTDEPAHHRRQAAVSQNRGVSCSGDRS
jgi:hypothetical protein